MSNTVIFITQLATVLGFVVVAFWLYRLLVSQKDATIEAIRERLETERANSPMTITKSLDERISIMERELERMKTENTELRTQVEQYRQEAREEAEEAKEEAELMSYMITKMLINWRANEEDIEAWEEMYEEQLKEAGELERYREEKEERRLRREAEEEQRQKEEQDEMEQLRQYYQTKPEEFREELKRMEEELETRRGGRD